MAAEPAVDAEPRSSAAGSEVHAVLVEVVSEKTGYPAEVLEPAMQLDADLGIDSIKRVEILAAFQERLPEAPVIGPEHLGTIRTLGQIAEFLGGGSAGRPQPAEVGQAPPASAGERDEPFLPKPARGLPPPAPGGEAGAAAEHSQAGPSAHPDGRPLDGADRREAVRLPGDAEVWVLDDGSDLAPASSPSCPGPGSGAGSSAEPRSPSLATPGLARGPGPRSPLGLGRLADPRRLPPAPDRRPGLAEGPVRAFATVTRLGGSFGLDGLSTDADPTSGGLAGLAKTAGHEWPEVNCKAIDLDPSLARRTWRPRRSSRS